MKIAKESSWKIDAGRAGLALCFALANWGRGLAVDAPRDIAVVVDLSGSMNDDSQMWHTRTYVKGPDEVCPGLQVNLRDIWCALDGPAPSHPYVPGPEGETQYAGDTGPSFGMMTNWGSAIVPEVWNPTTDPGLFYLPFGTNITNSTLVSGLVATHYSSAERSVLLNYSSSNDGSSTSPSQHWKNRIAVVLGLAEWKSGKSGGKYGASSGGDGDNIVEANEMLWLEYPSYRVDWTWITYIDYMWKNASSKPYYTTDNRLKGRYGLKTFIDFILEDGDMHSQTDNLWATPEQPLQSVRDGVWALANVVAARNNGDNMSLEVFATTARHEVDLGGDVLAVSNRLFELQSGHYNTNTNLGGGLAQAIAELTSERARPNAAKVIVVASNGAPNVGANGGVVPEGSAAAEGYVLSEAIIAESLGIRIFTISAGCGSDWPLMQQVAGITNGQAFFAEGGPAEYAAELGSIFRQIGEMSGCSACDANCDGSTNLFDVGAFVDAVTASGPPACSACAGDTNGDGSVNLQDVTDFVNCVQW